MNSSKELYDVSDNEAFFGQCVDFIEKLPYGITVFHEVKTEQWQRPIGKTIEECHCKVNCIAQVARFRYTILVFILLPWLNSDWIHAIIALLFRGSRIKYGTRKSICEVIKQVKSSNLNSVAVCAPKFYIAMVPPTGFEPVRSKAKDFKSLMSANSITTAKKTVRW